MSSTSTETLLDLQTMEPVFARIFGEKSAMRLWFAKMKMLADTHGIKIDEADKKELFEKFSTTPPHSEVPAALCRLRDAELRGSSGLSPRNSVLSPATHGTRLGPWRPAGRRR